MLAQHSTPWELRVPRIHNWLPRSAGGGSLYVRSCVLTNPIYCVLCLSVPVHHLTPARTIRILCLRASPSQLLRSAGAIAFRLSVSSRTRGTLPLHYPSSLSLSFITLTSCAAIPYRNPPHSITSRRHTALTTLALHSRRPVASFNRACRHCMPVVRT